MRLRGGTWRRLDGIALVPATSYGLAVAARNLTAAPGEQVLVLAEEYPSNYYTWKRFCQRTHAELVVVAREAGQSWTEAVVARIGEQARIVAVPNVHWTNGSLLELGAVARAVRRAGAALVVDASQSLGAMPLDVAAIQPDFVVSVGYKWLLGPFGLGCLYVAEQHRDGEPLEETGLTASDRRTSRRWSITRTLTGRVHAASTSASGRTSGLSPWRSRPASSFLNGRLPALPQAWRS
jgi:selenocysteine lyase/cysteine desulfurase